MKKEKNQPETDDRNKKTAAPWLKDIKEKKIVNPFGFRWSEQMPKEKSEKRNDI